MKRRIALAMAVFVALAMSACNKDEPEEAEPVSDRTIPRKVTARVSGARTWELNGTYQVRILTRPGTGKFIDTSVASITFSDFFPVSEGTFAQPEVAVAGMYTGDGDYTVPAGIGTRPTTGPTAADPGQVPGKVSVIQVTFTGKEPGSAFRFDYLLQACQVHLDNDASTGRATCPQLATHTGEVISLEISWGKP